MKILSAVVAIQTLRVKSDELLEVEPMILKSSVQFYQGLYYSLM